MTPFLAMVMPWPHPFAPKGWAFCHGQLLPIQTNQALFSLIGTSYGGDGRVNFALPDLRGRQVVGFSNDIQIGQRVGNEAGVKNSEEADAAVQPSVAMNYIIALQGIFPSQT